MNLNVHFDTPRPLVDFLSMAVHSSQLFSGRSVMVSTFSARHRHSSAFIDEVSTVDSQVFHSRFAATQHLQLLSINNVSGLTVQLIDSTTARLTTTVKFKNN